METFNATCGLNEVILVKSAKYGRMQIGRCVKRNLGYVGCSVDVLVYMDRQCSGQQTCTIHIPNPTLYATQPCPEDTTPYLEVAYECIPVVASSKKVCDTKKELVVGGGSGFIASSVTKTAGLGSVRCPWVVRAQPGQRVSLSLFNLYRSTETFQLLPGFESAVSRPEVCYEFAVLRDGGHVKSLTSCGGESRVSNIYLSRSSQVRIQFVNPNVLQTLGTYLLKYEAVGCPRLAVPKDGWAQVDGENAVIRCNLTDETWYLTCKGTAWLGQTGNCTKADPSWHLGTIIGDGASFPYGILIVVAIGVALGVFFGGILLTVVVIYMRRRHRHTRNPEDTSAGVVPSEDVEERLRAAKFLDGGERMPWCEQLKYRSTLLEERCPRGGRGTRGGDSSGDATSSFSTLARGETSLTPCGGGSTYKSPALEEPSIYCDKEVRSTAGPMRPHIYESPQFS